MKVPPTRYYGLDAIRASMMLLGIVLHLAIPYTGVTIRGYYVTNQTVPGLQLVLILHYFRMPVFFLLSGFFSALLWELRGVRVFLCVRWRRIGLVCLAALIVESPLVALVSIYNHFASEQSSALKSTWKAITSGRVDSSWLQDPPIHLWFLEYLMLFCMAAAVVLEFLKPFLPTLDCWMEKVIRSKLRTVALSIPTALTLWNMPLARVPYPNSFVPWLGVCLEYGWFYFIGWLIYRRRDLLPLLAGSIRAEKVAAPVLLFFVLTLDVMRLKRGPAGAPLLDLAIAFLTSLFIWSIVIVLIAASHNIRPGKWLPYLADASYWIYIAHYPVALMMPALLRHLPIPPILKVFLSSVFIFILFLAAYDRFVRYTFIGRALNGARTRGTALNNRQAIEVV